MGLRQTRRRLRETILSTHHRSVFEEGRRREPALAERSNLLALLAIMSNGNKLHYPEREVLIRAILREHQRAPSSLWTSAMLLIFMPMLMSMRGRVGGSAFTVRELDQMMIETFLEVMTRFPVNRHRDRLALRLRQATRRALFQRIGQQQQAYDRMNPLDEEVDWSSRMALLETRSAGTPAAEPAEDEQEELVELLQERVGQAVPAARLEVVTQTLLRGESVRDYVARRHPELPEEERERTYQRIKRERHRTLERLRPLLVRPDD